ncbi:MAG: hypothetical protein ACI9PY_002468 [Ascidiaceihabitans sp.]
MEINTPWGHPEFNNHIREREMGWEKSDYNRSGQSKTFDDPYSHWEDATRPKVLCEDPDNLWKPVYIRVKKGPKVAGAKNPYAKNAQILRGTIISTPNASIIGQDSLRLLDMIVEGEASEEDARVYRYLFIYRLAHEAHKELKTEQGKSLYEIVQIGPLVPRSSLVLLSMPNAKVADTHEVPKTHKICKRVVLTGVIDDTMGIAHERFRKTENTTRITHFWRQGVEGFNNQDGTTAVVIGQEFTGQQINGMLQNTASETAFYHLLRNISTNEGWHTRTMKLVSILPELLDGTSELIPKTGDRGAIFRTVLAQFREEFEVLQQWFPDDDVLGFVEALKAISQGDAVLFADNRIIKKMQFLKSSASHKFFERLYIRHHGYNASHGTAMLDLAAGLPLDSNQKNDRPIVAVELPQLATVETNGARLDFYVLQALHRILFHADNFDIEGKKYRVPVVINFSYGITAGPKDGNGFLEDAIKRIIEHREKCGLMTKVVLPAGNTYRSALTGRMEIKAAKIDQIPNSDTIEWQIAPQDYSTSYLEVRLSGSKKWRLTLTPPLTDPITIQSADIKTHETYVHKHDELYKAAIYVEPIHKPSDNATIKTDFDHTRVVIALAPTIAFDDPQHKIEPGTYAITISNGERGAAGKSLTARIDAQRDDTPSGFSILGRQSYLDDPEQDGIDEVTKARRFPKDTSAVKTDETLSAFSTAFSDCMFVVGGTYPDSNRLTVDDANVREPARYSSAGADGKRCPDLSAISEQGRAIGGVLAAGPFSGSTVMISGTSAAAPQVTREIVTALLRNPDQSTKAEILKAILPTSPKTPDARLGQGTIRDIGTDEKIGRPQRRRPGH